MSLLGFNSATRATYETNVARILTELRTLQEPASAGGFVTTLSKAIQQQRVFFQKWDTALVNQRPFAFPTGSEVSGIDPNVGKASAGLIQLYTDLMARYGTEYAQNREAFYQHLCALDFL